MPLTQEERKLLIHGQLLIRFSNTRFISSVFIYELVEAALIGYYEF
tara:strand:+ start:1641 stop:1778 length:138 start_codon:yes stop_codon:yes gene_type:complete